MTQYKKVKESLHAQGKGHYDRKWIGYGGQTKLIFHTDIIMLRLEPDCRFKRMWKAIRRERAKRFSFIMILGSLCVCVCVFFQKGLF